MSKKARISVPKTSRGWHLYYRMPAPIHKGETARILVLRSDTEKVFVSVDNTPENMELVDFICEASKAQVDASD